MYLKTWYEPLLEAPREPRIIDDSPPPPAARPLAGLRRRTAAALFALGRLIAPEPGPKPLIQSTNRPAPVSSD